jgi:hypothetical protein
MACGVLPAVSPAVSRLQSQLYDFELRFPHIRRRRITVNVHGCADVGMAYQLLLHTDCRP